MLKKQNEIELTAEQLTELKQDVSALVTAASQRHQFESSRSTLLTIKGQLVLVALIAALSTFHYCTANCVSRITEWSCLFICPSCLGPQFHNGRSSRAYE